MALKYLYLAVCGSVFLCVSFIVARASEGGYHLLKKYDLGAAPGGKEYWDYISFDKAARRLYVSHNTELKVVDADSGAIVGSIADLKRMHGTALVSELGRGFISDGGADEVVMFDMKTLKLPATSRPGATRIALSTILLRNTSLRSTGKPMMLPWLIRLRPPL